MAEASIEICSTLPFDDQRPGTSGLRKKVKRFQAENYLANFIQALFNAIPEEDYKDATLLVSGDGRYWNVEAIQIIAEIAAGNGVGRIWAGVNGWCSTPAGSCIVREREGGVCRGALLLTASHNPGGPNEDFGIKYNCANGGPAPESVTEAIYRETLTIKEFKRIKLPRIDLSVEGRHEPSPNFTVEVINPVEDWLNLMKNIFDFDLLKSLVARPDFSFVYDGLNGIAGPYAKALFVEELGCDKDCLAQCEPLEDFGGHHPDPNLTYAKRLVEQMAVNPCSQQTHSGAVPDFGAAGDGDNDRNMILGRGWFVTPSDSVAIIADYAEQCIPYFQQFGLNGVARSMPTSEALKRVSEAKGLKHYEVPTGWKYFGNLMDAGLCSICGEESFGTGSNHIREKDGLWAVLAWLSIIAHKCKSTCDGTVVSVREINEEFWKTYGRNYYVRFDYEGVSLEGAKALLEYVAGSTPTQLQSNSGENARTYLDCNPLERVDVFEYHDPVDETVSVNQGVRVFFADKSRFVIRMSGTGSQDATVRLYMEKFSPEYHGVAQEVMLQFINTVLGIIKIEGFLQRQEPTVRT